MSERDDAIRLANTILDEPHLDPDGDVCLLARQFLREIERGTLARSALERFAAIPVGVSANDEALAADCIYFTGEPGRSITVGEVRKARAALRGQP